MLPTEFNKKKYSEIWTELNRRLKHIERTDGGLAAALEALSNQQREQGFIQDDQPLGASLSLRPPRGPDALLHRPVQPGTGPAI